MVVSPTDLGTSLISQFLVLLERNNEQTQAACELEIAPLTSIIKGQIAQVEAMGLSTFNLAGKLKDLSDFEEGRYYAAAEIAIDIECPPVLLFLKKGK